jgi:hypothetical protein
MNTVHPQCHNKLLVKVLRNDMKHFDFEYKFGLNILKDKLEHNPAICVGPGGLYYCDIMNLDSHIYRGDFICVVEIPEDAIVIQINGYHKEYFRTDKLILTDKVYRFDNEDDVKELISINPEIECYLPQNQTIVSNSKNE